MSNQSNNRRHFLQMGLQGAALFAAGGLLRFKQAAATGIDSGAFHSLNNLGPLLEPDANGLKLPAGFKSRVIARSGEAPAGLPGYTWHSAPDGGATFPADDGGWIYVSNSEMPNFTGGVGAIRFDAEGEIVDAYQILKNTSINCAGGPTPWGTWLSCEEFTEGQVYECDPMGKNPSVLRPALGTFEHEAVAVDSENQCLYLTEDLPDGAFYKFTPENSLPDISSGKLEIASVAERNGKSFVDWVSVPDPLAKAKATRLQVPSYTVFKGGEGIAIYEGRVYFTTKHDNRVWVYHTSTQQLEVLYDVETSDNPILRGVDNVVITPTGDVLIAEDGGDMQIVV
ncbi:MAG: DUF839 domain-containing protein, partial [Gammaproteobacteria bacterium]|nr:DUF839 domain-containing protein [Gammaproteobacteria bacterium]